MKPCLQVTDRSFTNRLLAGLGELARTLMGPAYYNEASTHR